MAVPVRSLLLLCALLSGCEPPATNPDARLSPGELLLCPGECSTVRVAGVAQFGDLRARSDGTVATHELMRGERGLDRHVYLQVCGREQGSGRVDLLNGGAVVDTVFVEVASPDRFGLTAAQNADDHYPTVPDPVALLVGRRAFVYVVGLSTDGRSFETDCFFTHAAIVAPPVEVSVDLGGWLFEPMSPVAGNFPVELVGRTESRWTDLVVVEPEDIVGIEVAGVDDGEGGGSYSVTGVTADGQHVLGLDAALTINGMPRESTLGRWLFSGLAPGPGVTVVAEWNGFSATITW